MPFLVGKLESPEEPVEKPLSQPLEQLHINAANLPGIESSCGLVETGSLLFHQIPFGYTGK
jgi:hypothetical protein